MFVLLSPKKVKIFLIIDSSWIRFKNRIINNGTYIISIISPTKNSLEYTISIIPIISIIGLKVITSLILLVIFLNKSSLANSIPSQKQETKGTAWHKKV